MPFPLEVEEGEETVIEPVELDVELPMPSEMRSDSMQ